VIGDSVWISRNLLKARLKRSDILSGESGLVTLQSGEHVFVSQTFANGVSNTLRFCVSDLVHNGKYFVASSKTVKVMAKNSEAARKTPTAKHEVELDVYRSRKPAAAAEQPRTRKPVAAEAAEQPRTRKPVAAEAAEQPRTRKPDAAPAVDADARELKPVLVQAKKLQRTASTEIKDIQRGLLDSIRNLVKSSGLPFAKTFRSVKDVLELN